MEKFFALPRYPFNRAAIEAAPEEAGIYGLFDGTELIYIGRAPGGAHGIKALLLAHQDGLHGSCTMKAATYTWEITIWSAAREVEVLTAFVQQNRREPRCQQRTAA